MVSIRPNPNCAVRHFSVPNMQVPFPSVLSDACKTHCPQCGRSRFTNPTLFVVSRRWYDCLHIEYRMSERMDDRII